MKSLEATDEYLLYDLLAQIVQDSIGKKTESLQTPVECRWASEKTFDLTRKHETIREKLFSLCSVNSEKLDRDEKEKY